MNVKEFEIGDLVRFVKGVPCHDGKPYENDIGVIVNSKKVNDNYFDRCSLNYVSRTITIYSIYCSKTRMVAKSYAGDIKRLS